MRRALAEGFAGGCRQSGAVWGGGETPALSGPMVAGTIALASSGVHTNGLRHGARKHVMSEVLAPTDFIRDLVARIEARRTFGGHPLWLELADGKLSREQLKLFAVQFFLQVREFPAP